MRFAISISLAACAITVGSAVCLAADGKLGVELVERDGKVVISEVMKGSDAASVGIEAGDILYKVGAKKIATIQDALDAKSMAKNNEDIPFIFETPGGLWDVNARFEKGQPYGKYSAPKPRPKKK
jgi:S1-C subfamily serine protease